MFRPSRASPDSPLTPFLRLRLISHSNARLYDKTWAMLGILDINTHQAVNSLADLSGNAYFYRSRRFRHVCITHKMGNANQPIRRFKTFVMPKANTSKLMAQSSQKLVCYAQSPSIILIPSSVAFAASTSSSVSLPPSLAKMESASSYGLSSVTRY